MPETCTATIRIFSGQAPIACATVSVAQNESAFTVPPGPVAELFRQFKPGDKIEILVHKGAKRLSFTGDVVKFEENDSVTLEAKAVTR